MDNIGVADRYEPHGGTPTQVAARRNGYLVTWTTQPNSTGPSQEAQHHARELARKLERVAPLRERLELHLLAGSPEHAKQQAAAIGLVDGLIMRRGVPVPAVDVVFSDGTGLSRLVATAVPWSELADRLGRLLRVYMVEGCAKDSFIPWTTAMAISELRERLGLQPREPEPQSSL